MGGVSIFVEGWCRGRRGRIFHRQCCSRSKSVNTDSQVSEGTPADPGLLENPKVGASVLRRISLRFWLVLFSSPMCDVSTRLTLGCAAHVASDALLGVASPVHTCWFLLPLLPGRVGSGRVRSGRVCQGYSIGSASLACFLLFGAFMDEFHEFSGREFKQVDIAKPEVLIGGLLGVRRRLRDGHAGYYVARSRRSKNKVDFVVGPQDS